MTAAAFEGWLLLLLATTMGSVDDDDIDDDDDDDEGDAIGTEAGGEMSNAREGR